LATYLDPLAYNYLDTNQIKQAEKIIYELLPNSKNSKNQEKNNNLDSSSTSENGSKASAEMFSFDKVCGVTQTITNSKASGKVFTTKEELAQYISTKGQYSDLTVFWRENEQKLPKLSSLVRK
jgi:hypothetical protein